MNVYETLREILDTHPSGAPASPVFDEILRILFSEEEAALAVHMSFLSIPLSRIAELAGVDAAEAGARLEEMADRGVAYSRGPAHAREYALVPTIPGLYEFPFMKKSTPDRERLGALWARYHTDALGAAFAGRPTPLMRVVPVEKALGIRNQVLPYDEVAGLIRRASFRAQGTCACRESMGRCDAPRDVCLFFDKPARAMVERGFAREVSADEAIVILDRSEAAGLVHTTNNSADRATVLCSCCPCCCTILRGRTELDLVNAFSPSAWIADVVAADCNGCGVCAEERCPVGAIAMTDELAVVTKERCIGCGLCVSACPTDAARLTPRAERPFVPETVTELGLRVASEKGKFERFMEVMSRAQAR